MNIDSVANDASPAQSSACDGVAGIVLAKHSVERAVCDPTRRYHRQLHRCLVADGVETVAVRPGCAGCLAEALGLLVESVPADAQVLARNRRMEGLEATTPLDAAELQDPSTNASASPATNPRWPSPPSCSSSPTLSSARTASDSLRPPRRSSRVPSDAHAFMEVSLDLQYRRSRSRSCALPRKASASALSGFPACPRSCGGATRLKCRSTAREIMFLEAATVVSIDTESRSSSTPSLLRWRGIAKSSFELGPD